MGITKKEMMAYFENKEITVFDKNNEESKTLPENVRVEYVREHKKEREGVYAQLTHVDIYRDGVLVKSLVPELDPYMVIKDEYVFLSSDGKMEIYNTLLDKYYSQELSIVPFGFTVEWSDIDWDYKHTEKIPYSMTIKAEGCYWGAEDLSVYFELKLSKTDSKCYDLVLQSFKQWEDKENEQLQIL